MRATMLAAIAAASCLFVPAPRAALAAWPHDPFANVALAPVTNTQSLADALADGAGGAYAVWTDLRGGTEDLYLQHVTGAGQIAPGWPAAGFQVCTAAGRKLEPQLVADGSGGVLVVWTDYRSGPTNGDLFAQRVLANATLAPGFGAGGTQLTSLPYNDHRPRACTDGAGGALVAWESSYSATDADIYSAHLTAGGAVPYTGLVDNSLHDSRQVAVAPDLTGGFYTVYQDSTVTGVRIYGAHQTGAGAFIAGPLKISNAPGSYTRKQPHLFADGTGGIFAAWIDTYNTANGDLAFLHFGPSFANLAPFYDAGSWGAGGIDPATQDFGFVPDGLGGMYAAWVTANGTSHVFLQHYSANAVPYPGWPTSLDTGQLNSVYGRAPRIAPDGSGGLMLLCWGSSKPMTVVRYTAGAATPPRWPYDGALITAWGQSTGRALVSDGAYGAIALWDGTRTFNATDMQVWAQRVDRFAALGNAEPAIASVKDAPKDQGGQVRLVWNASYLDADPGYEIASYWVWRQTPAAAAARAVRAGTGVYADGPGEGAAATRPGARVFKPASTEGYAWEYLATQLANASAQYSYVAATTLDSTGASNPRTVFMVEAHSGWNAGFWGSAPDSGYSVDNLPPVTPAPFTGTYSAGLAALHWGRNTEADLAGYRLYRGTSVAFVPGPGNLVSAQPDTGYAYAAGAPYVYKLSAVDVHGNESPFAILIPAGTSGVGGDELPAALAFANASANPSPRGAVLRLALPRAARVRLAVYDAAGREVRVLADGAHDAGVWTREWDGRDAAGALAPSGLYFARLECGPERRTLRLALVR